MNELNEIIIERETDKIMSRINNKKVRVPFNYKIGFTGVFSFAIVLALLFTFAGVFTPKTNNFAANTLHSQQDLLDILAKYRSSSYQWVSDGLILTPNDAADTTTNYDSSGSNDYSRTNAQVQGVDEADVAKTDGLNIYLVSQGAVVIAKAYPASELSVVKTIAYDNFFPNQLYVDVDDAYLVVIGWVQAETYQDSHSRIYVFSKNDFDHPVNVIDVSGYIETTRKIDSRLVLVTSSYMYHFYNYGLDIYTNAPSSETVLPYYTVDGEVHSLDYPDIHYQENTYPNAFVTIYNFDLSDLTNPEYFAYLGSSGTVYMSSDSIYIAQSIYPVSVVSASSSDDSPSGSDGSAATSTAQPPVTGTADEPTVTNSTAIYHLPEPYYIIINFKAQTAVSRLPLNSSGFGNMTTVTIDGYLNDRYSMDESGGYFRIATTLSDNLVSSESNSLYIFDRNMNLESKLEGIAPGESIQSARFVGDRIYLVTYKNIDPLFVIDASNPKKPEILGELKVTGFSKYLEPYDENHIIGFGFATTISSTGTEKITGIKAALFDVTDPANPKEVNQPVVIPFENGYGYSAASYDPKALLFDKGKGILGFPISFSNYTKVYKEDGSYQYEYVYEQTYKVFHIDENGLEYKTDISHFDQSEPSGYQYIYEIMRGLYIDNNLYTVSMAKIKVNSLSDFSKVNEINLPYEDVMQQIICY